MERAFPGGAGGHLPLGLRPLPILRGGGGGGGVSPSPHTSSFPILQPWLPSPHGYSLLPVEAPISTPTLPAPPQGGGAPDGSGSQGASCHS